jgi:hypothetical protein
MARYCEPSPKQLEGYREWCASRPPNVRVVAERFTPWELFRLGQHRVIVRSFHEEPDGSVSLAVIVSGEFNRVVIERQVFGIDPAELTPCELPGPDEPVGVFLTDRADIDVYMAALKAAHPDHCDDPDCGMWPQ